MPSEIIEIDGSILEGGGQILRIAATLSVLTQTPIRVVNIRSGRSKPGLMEQHLKGLELVSQICCGKLKGGTIGSTSIELWPSRVKGGNFNARIRTAGSISLLLQIALPCTLYSDSDSILTLEGGTNADMAPQIDYTTEVFRPIMAKFGVTFDFELIKRGYFPKGGGKVRVTIKPVNSLKAIQMLESGSLASVYGWSFVAGTLPVQLAHNMADSACNELKAIHRNVKIERYKEDHNIAPDNCSGIILVAETSNGCILGGSGLGKRNETPEVTGRKAAQELLTSIKEGACVDEHSQDQIIVLMAIANGLSKIRVGKITLHTQTAIYVTEKLTTVKFEIIEHPGYSIIQCNGLGLQI